MTPKKLNSIILVLAFLSGLLFASSCSTKKNTGMRRAWHNMTCKYNVHWNGKNSLNEGAMNLGENIVDNYNDVLRLYNYGTKKEAQLANPKMDRTIKKASIGIQKHSMYFGGEEKVKWVRYSYQLMGKAHFYKHDYISARRVFDYVSKEYENDPVHYEGYLWLAKTHIETERFEKAEATLNLLQSKLEEKDFPSNVERDLAMVQADFYLAQKNYDRAYTNLERGIELGNKREVITRAMFILGQINQMEGDLELASGYYKNVINRNPNYIMAFEAKMNLAQSYDEGTGDSKNINKVLNKMLKDYQYKEFQDQIYYALADIALKDGNIEQAIEYLQKSVSTSVKDNYQKSKSSLELADIYFERAEYNPAQAYYDTAVTFLPTDYPDYDLIKKKANVLSEIVIHAQTLRLQDSLQHLAAMDTIALLAMIDGIIKDYQIEQERLREETELALEEGGVQFVNINDRSNQRLGGKWYFYNTQAKSMGRSEFINKWGGRKLEDNWRLSDKRGLLQSFDEDLVEEGEPGISDTTQTEVIVTDPETREFYLATIPGTPEEIQASHDLVIDAYQKLGFLYLEELNDTINALETYLVFQQKYPDNKYRIESWYALYKIYTEQGNAEAAARYKSLIVSNYPESNYAKVILDPDYYIKQSQEKGKAAKLYERAYEAFGREQYYRVITYADRALEQYPDDSALMPRFMFIRAISLGKVDVPDTLYAALDNLIVTYPESPVIPRAQAVLRMLQLEYGLGVPDDKKQELLDAQKEPSLYNYEPESMHMFIMVINSDVIELDPLKVRISDFKKKYFRLERLRIKSLMLDNQRSVITIGNFDNKEDAEPFYLAIQDDEYVLSGLSKNDFEMFTISMTNYPVLYREKNVKAYGEFFDVYYLDTVE